VNNNETHKPTTKMRHLTFGWYIPRRIRLYLFCSEFDAADAAFLCAAVAQIENLSQTLVKDF
jgi:hypothetical protein